MIKEVLIVPLWNWNDVKTKMENCVSQSFNRTFMELKLLYDNRRGIAEEVLIVPLWNWNLRPWAIPYRLCRFNRTFMELKLEPAWAPKAVAEF